MRLKNVACLACISFLLLGFTIPILHTNADSIPQGPFYRFVPYWLRFIRNPDFSDNYSNPLENVLSVPQHPFMADNGGNNMHCDAYMTDLYLQSGPIGVNPLVHSTFRGIAECVTICFTSTDQMVTGCTSPDRPRLILMNSTTLGELKRYELPRRPISIFDPIKIFEDTSGGAYFYLDNKDRVVVATHEQAIEIVQVPKDGEEFQLVQKIDLSGYVIPREFPERDKVGSVLPDWGGRLWFVTRYGAVGVINTSSGYISNIALKVPNTEQYEEIQNSFTIGEDGVYIISDYALYRFNVDSNEDPIIDWRVEYDRGSRKKPGMLNQGSGTTPTLMGDLVAIGDNADPRMNVQFHYRNNGTLACRIPVFEDNRSCTEDSLISVAWKNGSYSVIVANNYGHKNLFAATLGRSTEPGVTRIDITPADEGYICEEIWMSKEIPVSALPKLSLGNGLIYLYTKDPNRFGLNLWYFTAVDFESGKTVYKLLAGTGFGYNNNWGPINLGPDGSAYVGMLFGLLSIRDNTV